MFVFLRFRVFANKLESMATATMCGGDSLLQKSGLKHLSNLNTGTIVGLVFLDLNNNYCGFFINDGYIVCVVF